jgi:hypothetical protein
MKASNLSEVAEVEFSRTTPIRMHFPIFNDKGDIYYFLAPRDDDEDEEGDSEGLEDEDYV